MDRSKHAVINHVVGDSDREPDNGANAFSDTGETDAPTDNRWQHGEHTDAIAGCRANPERHTRRDAEWDAVDRRYARGNAGRDA